MRFRTVPFSFSDVYGPSRALDRAFVGAAVNAILEPYGLAPPDPGNSLRGGRILDMVETICERAGVAAGHSGRNLLRVNAQALWSTSDFPVILNGVIGQALLAGWESGPHTYERFCGYTDVNSLRPEQRIVVGGLGTLQKIAENGEVAAKQIPGYGMLVQAEAYGALFGITYEALVNNDLSNIITVAKTIGRTAAATIDQAVFGLIGSNPTMLDNGTLFNSIDVATAGGHANLATSGSQISGSSIAVGKTAMRRQIAPGGDRPLNVRPRFLIVSAENEESAWSAVGLPQGFGESGSDVERYLLDAGRVEPISTPYLSGTGWYLAADPNIAPLVNIALLHGQAVPVLASKLNFNTNGIDFIARFDFGASPADWRGGYSNPGA